jgi:serine/threonine-protein kinase
MSEDRELTADLALPARLSADTTAEHRAVLWDEHTEALTRSVARPTPAPAPVQHDQRRRRRGPLAVAMAVLLVAALGAGAWWFGFARYTSMPGVLGLTQQAATAKLEAAGLDVTVGEAAYSNTVKAGRVLRTDPAGGDRVLDGGTVTMTLSKGVEQYKLPNLAGKSLDEAQDALLAIKMSYGKGVAKWSETVPKGQVIRTDPVAGATLRPGTSVDVWVSRGRQPIKVSDWTGKSGDTAEAQLKKAGLEVESDSQYDDDVAAGLVISQSPDSGTLYRGDTVSLLVSKGPELVQVPSLRAWGVEAATKELKRLGFTVRTAHADAYIGVGYVWSTDPGGGSKIPKGSTVTLNLL